MCLRRNEVFLNSRTVSDACGRGGVTHWLWRAVDEHGAVLDVLLQWHGDTSAATFFRRLLGDHDVSETVCTEKPTSYGAAIHKLPLLDEVDHQQVISTARCNNLIEQRASVVIGSVLPKAIPPSYTASGAKSNGVRNSEPGTRISRPVRQNQRASILMGAALPKPPVFTALPPRPSLPMTDDLP